MSENKSEESKNIIVEEIPEPASSIALAIFVFIHKIYIYIYNIIALLLFIFKKFAFDYKTGTCAYEVILAIIFLFCDIIRIRLTTIGNKTERALILLFAILFGVVVLFGYFYFIFIHKFATYFDVAFNSIGIVIILIEILFSLIAMFYIKVHEKNM